MRFITTAFLIGLMIAAPSISLGALPPTSVQGQSGTKSTAFDFQAPYNQYTKTGSTKALLETSSFQLLKNPGFEATTYSSNWTASGGTLAAAATTNIFYSKGATWDASAASQTFTSDAITVPEGFKGNNCEASKYIKVPSGTTTSLIQAWDGTNVLASASVINSTYFTKNTVTFPCPTSGMIALRLISVASDEPLIALDEAYLGLARNVGSTDLTTEWVSFTPTGSWAGTTAYSGKWRQVGDSREFQLRVVPGSAPTGTSLTVTISSVCTIDTTKLASGTGEAALPEADGSMLDNGSYFGIVKPLYSSTTAVQLRANNSTTNTTLAQISPTAPITWTTGDTIDASFVVPCVGWAASTVVMPNAQGLSWSGLHAGNCTWTTTSATFASPSADASCTFTERTNRNFGTVSSEGSKLPGIVFTPRVTGTYFVCATVHGYNSAASGYVAFSLRNSTTSTNISTAGRRQGSSGGLNDEQPMTICGLTVISSAASTTITILMLASSGTSTLVSNSSANAIEWSIFNADQPVQAILANSVSTGRTNGVQHETFRISSGSWPNACTADPCTVSNSSISGITVARGGTGDYTATISSGTFNNAPNCTCNAFLSGTGPRSCSTNGATTTTSIAFRPHTGGGTASDAALEVVCSALR